MSCNLKRRHARRRRIESIRNRRKTPMHKVWGNSLKGGAGIPEETLNIC
jgi:hypothetical protein